MHRPSSLPPVGPSFPKAKASFSRRRSANPLTPSSPHISLRHFDSPFPIALKQRNYKVLAIYANLVIFTLLLVFFFHASPSSRTSFDSSLLETVRNRTLATDAMDPSVSPLMQEYSKKLDNGLARAFEGFGGRKFDGTTVYGLGLTDAQRKRYAHLKEGKGKERKWLFTSVLLNVAGITPDIFSSLLVVTDFLGPSNIGLSIVEGPSSDGTDTLFETVLSPLLISMGVSPLDIHLNTRRPSAQFSKGNRIELLAKLREEALVPLRRGKLGAGKKGEEKAYEASVFFNDVYFSGAMMLEMIHQHVTQGADMTCAWDLLWGNDYFYDTWVARDIHTGDLFHPMSTTWSPSTNLFPTSPLILERYEANLPFQAASCWNGIAVLSASPLLSPPNAIHFRRSRLPPSSPSSSEPASECAAAEVSLLCQDLWLKLRPTRHARILVVPGVKVAYERHVAEGARDVVLFSNVDNGGGSGGGGWWRRKGASNGGEANEVGGSGVRVGRVRWGKRGEKVGWVGPPPKIRCHPWPEINGTGGVNIWEGERWVDVYTGV